VEDWLSCWAQRAAFSSTKCSWLHSSFAEVSTDELNTSKQSIFAITECLETIFKDHLVQHHCHPWGWKGPTAIARVQPEGPGR